MKENRLNQEVRRYKTRYLAATFHLKRQCTLESQSNNHEEVPLREKNVVR